MLSQSVRTHAEHANVFPSFPLLKSPQELGKLSICHQISMAVWSGLFAAAVWKMKTLSASGQCIELSNHGINTLTLPRLHLLC